MMLSELLVLLQAHGSNGLTEFRRLIEEENLLGKPTFTSRHKSFRHLVELYGLESSHALFRVLLRLACVAKDAIPLLALVCVYCRASSGPVLACSNKQPQDLSFPDA